MTELADMGIVIIISECVRIAAKKHGIEIDEVTQEQFEAVFLEEGKRGIDETVKGER